MAERQEAAWYLWRSDKRLVYIYIATAMRGWYILRSGKRLVYIAERQEAGIYCYSDGRLVPIAERQEARGNGSSDECRSV